MNATTLLHRQVNPSWIQSGRVTSQVFKPTAKDNLRLSVYDGDKIDASDAWQHYTGALGFSSAGVISVSVGECQSLELVSESDPTPFPEHALILFGEYSNAETEKKAKQLRAFALSRGWLFQAEPDPE